MKTTLLTLLFFIFLTSCNHSKIKTDESTKSIKDANIFILAGQSNAVGQHELNKILTNLPSNYQGPQKKHFGLAKWELYWFNSKYWI
jgi:hypothetical protein